MNLLTNTFHGMKSRPDAATRDELLEDFGLRHARNDSPLWSAYADGDLAEMGRLLSQSMDGRLLQLARDAVADELETHTASLRYDFNIFADCPRPLAVNQTNEE